EIEEQRILQARIEALVEPLVVADALVRHAPQRVVPDLALVPVEERARLRERQEHVDDHRRAIAVEQEVQFLGEPEHGARIHPLAEHGASEPRLRVDVGDAVVVAEEVVLRTQDYFFRYDHGVTNVHPKSWLGRAVLGKWMDSGTVLGLAEKLHFLLDRDRPTVIVDVFLPFSQAGAFLDWYEREIGHYPLWCVPYKRVRDYEWLDESFYAGLEDPLFLDLAIYGLEQP